MVWLTQAHVSRRAHRRHHEHSGARASRSPTLSALVTDTDGLAIVAVTERELALPLDSVVGLARAVGASAPALVLVVYASVYVLTALVPVARLTRGYAVSHVTHDVQLYRLNGVYVLAIVVACAVAAVRAGLVRAEVFARQYAAAAGAAAALGLALSVASFVRGRALAAAGALDRRARCATADTLKPEERGRPPRAPTPAEAAEFDARSPLVHFYAGLSEFNPVGPLGVDVKMFLYLAGAVQLLLNVLSVAAAHAAARADGALAPGAAAYVACLAFFVVEYIVFEEPHTYTYDIFRERVGFKLVWGCTCFYPFFYALPATFLSTSDAAVTPAFAAAGAALYLAGWVLTRGANMQKFACKTGAPFLCGLVPMRTLPGSRGRLLVSGFWGAARHVNYLGEIVQAVALAALAARGSGSAVPFLYPLYYVALFVPRQADDDALLASKYGEKLFRAYCEAVPARIVPFVY